MRKIIDFQDQLRFYNSESQKAKEYEKISEIIEKNSGTVYEVAKDFQTKKEKIVGAKGLTVDQVIRLALLKQKEQISYHELWCGLFDNIVYKSFSKLHTKRPPCKSTLQQNIKRISAKSWDKIMQIPVKEAREKKIEKLRRLRMDATGIETNVHHPTDSRLLWDCCRVLTRIMVCVKEEYPEMVFLFHDHTKRVKKRVFCIANTKKKEKRKKAYQDMLHIMKHIKEYAAECIRGLKRKERQGEIEAKLYRQELERYLSCLDRIMNQTRKRVFQEEKVESRDKLVSIFEPHTDIIVKGSRSPVFGHKVLLTGGESGLIVDCLIQRGNWNDKTFFEEGLDSFKNKYSCVPKEIATDGGFASKDNYLYAKSKGILNVLFTKKMPGRMVELIKTSHVYKRLKKFRAGIEGCISAAKRAYGLDRCLWKGWEGFQRYVLSCIAAFNFTLVARALL